MLRPRKYLPDDVTIRRVSRSLYMPMDTETFETMVRALRDRVYSYALYSLRTREDAEDVTQEAFLRLWRRCPARDVAAVRAWLLRVVYNLCVDLSRRRRTARVRLGRPVAVRQEELPDTTDQRTDPALRLELDQQQQELLRALATLSSETRNVLLLHYFEGMTFGEIGELLGKNVSSLKVRVHRARKTLRGVLTAAVDDPPAQRQETG